MKIKNLKVTDFYEKNIKDKKTKIIKGGTAIVLAGVMAMSFSGCNGRWFSETVVNDATEYSEVIDSNAEEVEIKTQEIDVPGEDFKLVVEYNIDSEDKTWRITDNKSIQTKIYTKGLKDNEKVWIDNTHIDVFTVSNYETMNGITQDSMDDRIHNSQMIGFPINDNTYLINDFIIEGQNDQFISGSVHGFSGYSSGTVTSKRFTESDYLNCGVYANSIVSSYGLLIQKGDGEIYGVDVKNEIIVLINNKVKKEYNNGDVVLRTYNRDGSYSEEDLVIAKEEKGKEKVKTNK